MNEPIRTTFEELVKDVILLNNVMLSIRNDGAIAEVKLKKILRFELRNNGPL
jgi:hypothetical protein